MLLRLGLALLLSHALAAEDTAEVRASYIRNHYDKFEVQIPTRDGKRLFTSIYCPRGIQFGKTYPVLLMRTPYSVSPYGLDRYRGSLAPNANYEKEGYIFAFQDVRGRWMSEGEFVNMRPRQAQGQPDEASDTYDTIEWLLRHLPGNNGRVGMWGISYPGFYTAYGAIDSHPGLKAISPQAPIADWWRGDDMHRNGAFNLQLSYTFFANFGQPRPQPTEEGPKPFEYPTNDPYQYFLELGPLSRVAESFGFKNAFWDDLRQHPDYDDFWQSRNLLPHLRNVRAATMVVGGWFDTEDLYGPLNIYQSIRKFNPQTATHLVMGPWSHGAWWRTPGNQLGEARFGADTSATYQEVEKAFFDQHLKGAPPASLPGAWVFETGANRWRSFSSWPPASARPRTLHLREGQSLQGAGSTNPGFAEFLSDPSKPVPYTQENGSIRQSKEYMTEDQRFAARRPDVLVFQGPPLQEEVTVAGPIQVDLWVSTSRADADWIVKLVDVFPGKISQAPGDYQGGLQMLVRGEPMRGRYRESWSRPRPFEPDQPTRVRFTLNDCFHTFQRQHRIMIQVQSSWFPYIDRNPQSWVGNLFQARPGDFVSATHRLYWGPKHDSRVELPLLPAWGEP